MCTRVSGKDESMGSLNEASKKSVLRVGGKGKLSVLTFIFWGW